MRAKSFRWMLVVLATAAMIRTIPAAAQLGPILLKVEVIGDTERSYQKRHKSRKQASSPKLAKIVRERQLDIFLTNHTKENLQSLTIKYYVFGADINSDEARPVRTGNLHTSVPALGKTNVKSDRVTLTENAETVKVKDDKKYTVPASGYDFAGYGVQVYDGDKMLAEVFDPVDLKAKASTSWTVESDSKDSKKKSP